MTTAGPQAIDPLITNAAPETWPDLFPLPEGYSVEPQPLTGKQLGELTALDATENTWVIEWGVRDDTGRVTECESKQDARAYQAAHGGKLVSREASHTYW